jgi:bifunctional non-homologous end joining protein LigD
LPASKCSGARPDKFCALALAWGCRSTTTAVFDLIRPQRHGADAVLCAFGLIELDVEDLRRTVIEQRKGRLVRLIRDRHPASCSMRTASSMADVFKNACALGCEGIVSKRLGSPYRSRRSKHWVKVKNPKAPAVKREAEED